MRNPCGNAHFQNYPCRECERLRKLDESEERDLRSVPEASISGPIDQDQSVAKRVTYSPGASRGVDIADDAPSKSDLEQLVDDAVKRETLSAAEKQRRYRARHGAKLREANRDRMRRKRGV